MQSVCSTSLLLFFSFFHTRWHSVHSLLLRPLCTSRPFTIVSLLGFFSSLVLVSPPFLPPPFFFPTSFFSLFHSKLGARPIHSPSLRSRCVLLSFPMCIVPPSVIFSVFLGIPLIPSFLVTPPRSSCSSTYPRGSFSRIFLLGLFFLSTFTQLAFYPFSPTAGNPSHNLSLSSLEQRVSFIPSDPSKGFVLFPPSVPVSFPFSSLSHRGGPPFFDSEVQKIFFFLLLTRPNFLHILCTPKVCYFLFSFH